MQIKICIVLAHPGLFQSQGLSKLQNKILIFVKKNICTSTNQCCSSFGEDSSHINYYLSACSNLFRTSCFKLRSTQHKPLPVLGNSGTVVSISPSYLFPSKMASLQAVRSSTYHIVKVDGHQVQEMQ